MNSGANNPDRILRLKEVCARTGLSRSSIYLKISNKAFPKPIKLGARAVGWFSHEIDAWLQECTRRSRPDSSNQLDMQ